LLLSTTRSFLETFDVDISPRKYKLKVRTPRIVKQDKEALSRQDVQTILNACHHFRLKTYTLFLASTGLRAVEALSIRLCDINWNNDPAPL
jgi:integrase